MLSGLIETDVPLGPLTTYKAGGPTRYYAKPANDEQLDMLAEFLIGRDLEVLVIGRGSNLLVSDRGFDGLTIHMATGFDSMSFDGLEVKAGAGTPLPRLARASVEAGIAGLEFFVGVPGSVGGAVRQNAGCFGVEAKDRMVEASIFDTATGARFTASPDDLDMGYRHSSVEPGWVVTAVVFQGTSHDTTDSGVELRRITRWRKENQPGGTLNAGSVFKNPEGTSAGRLIEEAGLKGFSVGQVSVSEKHANFFVATPTASSADVRALVFEVREIVESQSGIRLEPEIQMVGFDDDD